MDGKFGIICTGMLKTGENVIDGVAVDVVRKKARRISLRVKADGSIHLTVPQWRATLAMGEAFLRSKWEWALKARARALARPAPVERDATPLEVARLQTLLDELHSVWSVRLGEPGVDWKLRRMKTRWGVCNHAKRKVTYAEMLAVRPRDEVEYVVVHELTHLKAHNHGPAFKALMDRRLPDWRDRRKRLNSPI